MGGDETMTADKIKGLNRKEYYKKYSAVYRQSHKKEIAAYRDAHKDEKSAWQRDYYARIYKYKQRPGSKDFTKCNICVLCGALYGVLRKKNGITCPDCGREVSQTRIGLYQMEKKGDIDQLKKIRQEMIQEEGPGFTELIMGPVCKRARDAP
jgi:hypothetical protein